MKALGVPEFMSYLRGERDLKAAIAAAQTSTRRYAKRQLTWFRHQMPDAVVLRETDRKERLNHILQAVFHKIGKGI
jgi:tRNA dimethylallyltransferase